MTQAWLIRAGRAGEREQWALRNGVSGGGFYEVADLTDATTRESVAALVAEGFPGAADGKLQNAGFLDYRIPVASDLPMIDTIIVEVPNPRHPYGVRGIGETPICPPMAAMANAVHSATGIRFTALPMSPPKVLAAIDKARADGHKALKV